MTFWQENYGFVKEVYDYRIIKYQEWMDNLEAIVIKVMSTNVQYTYKEFKTIQDSLGSLCRDLEKDGMKEWLDLMLEKVAVRVGEEGGSSRDKELKKAERIKLQGLITRHDKLMPGTKETQEKVETYARCYAYGDDISQVFKTLEEMLHLSTKEIHPHNMKMVEDQIDKADKVIYTLEGCQEQFDEGMKRGQKLLKVVNCAPFMGPLIEKFEVTWKAANEKSKDRLSWLKAAINDWESYDANRESLNEPCEKLEADFKKYRKFFDPVMAAKKLNSRKALLDDCKTRADSMYEIIKKTYETIVVLAGAEKKEYLDREVLESGEKKTIIAKCEQKVQELEEYNGKLKKAVDDKTALNDWARPTEKKIKEICSCEDMTPEDRVNEIMTLKIDATTKSPLLEPLEVVYHELLTSDDLDVSETARNTMADFDDMKKYVIEVVELIEKEAGSITQDQMFYADYLSGVKVITPWMADAEKVTGAALEKPVTLESCIALLEICKQFDGDCGSNKDKLNAAGKARENMEKASTTENLFDPLSNRWDNVKKISTSRIANVETLLATWTLLQNTTVDLADKMSEIPKQNEPNLAEIEKVYATMKALFSKKKELLTAV